MSGARLRQTRAPGLNTVSTSAYISARHELGQKPRDPGLPWRLAQGVGGGGGAHASPPAPLRNRLGVHANTRPISNCFLNENGSPGSNPTGGTSASRILKIAYVSAAECRCAATSARTPLPAINISVV